MRTPLTRGNRPGAYDAWANLKFDDLPPSPSRNFFYSRLSAQHRKFVDNLIISQDPQSAAVNAGFSSGRTAYISLLKDTRIRSAIRERMEVITDLASITAADVRRDLKQIYEADTTEISGVWRVPCRHCWGEGNHFQYTDPELHYIEQAFSYGETGWPFACVTTEFGPILTKHASAAWVAGKNLREVDYKGGSGYSRTKEINPDCPQCHGVGEAMAYICDTRYLSEGGKKLFQGIKMNGEKIEVVTLNKQNILNMLARDTQVGVERRELIVNLPRTPEEFDKMVKSMSVPELEMFIANMVTLAETEFSEIEGIEEMAADGLSLPAAKFTRGK